MKTKIAIITGGSRGLGKAMALSLASKGCNVIITYASKKDEAQDVVNTICDMGIHAASLQLDLKVAGSIEVFVKELKELLKNEFNKDGFDFLVNNAGMGATVPFAEVTEALFDDFVNVHFKGVYFLTQQCLPLLRDNGCIINISSGTTRFCVPGYSVYSSMKGAIEVLSRCLAKELGGRGITVNVVAPGPVETDFNNAAIRNNPQMKTYLSNMSPFGRVGHPDDIGGIVAFLCSAEAGWISGQRIEVSGGINL